MTSIQERATAAALKRSKGQCTTGNVHLDEAIKYYIQVGFEDGAEWQREDLAGVTKCTCMSDYPNRCAELQCKQVNSPFGGVACDCTCHQPGAQERRTEIPGILEHLHARDNEIVHLRTQLADLIRLLSAGQPVPLDWLKSKYGDGVRSDG